MKRIFFLGFFFLCLATLLSGFTRPVFSAESYKLQVQITPLPCSTAPGLGDCPTDLTPIYNSLNQTCVGSYEDFSKNPITQHFWALDPEVTAQGQTDERARQFIYWAVNGNAIDEHPVLKQIWAVSRNIVFFLIVLVAAIIGIGFIVGQRANFDFKIKIWPVIIRLATLLLYVTFSATIVLLLIQMSEVLMKFFIETLSGKDLFNINFNINLGSGSVERNYSFIGCRDLNYQVQEAVDTEMFLLRATNVIYYLMGSLIILRKIILWFLLFVSPFLAVLAPFVFIRNVGWIWIGVFFQWLFYGPFLALFLGALSIIWKAGIPFIFNFSRAGNATGYVYPTAINIVYGGPAQIAAQNIGALNNGNYIDTFAEYVIALLMLLAATFFPWWLLRIFRDYCCDGINTAKNILLSIYDQMRGGPSPQPQPVIPSPTNITTSLKMPKGVEIPVQARLETLEEIKKTKTEEIVHSLNISTSKISDVANFETNKQLQQNIKQNLDYLTNPMVASTATERQKFMNIRSELFNRAVKEDRVARHLISSISSSKIEQQQRRQKLVKTIPKLIPVTHVVSIKVNMPQEKVSAINSALVNAVSGNNQTVQQLADVTRLQPQQISSVLHVLVQETNQPTVNLSQNIAKQTNLNKEKIHQVIKLISQTIKTNKQLLTSVAKEEGVEATALENVVDQQMAVMAEPEKYLAESVTIPPSVPLEEYESVKKIWQKQYEEGEVPVTENVRSRNQWVEQDIVFITNTLNKLVSSNEELRLQGLDDLGYILPIFLINSMKGDELVVYLKAKLEAAKTVAEQMAKERKLTEKLKSKSEEELIEVAAPTKKEAAKTMEMAEELKIKSEK